MKRLLSASLLLTFMLSGPLLAEPEMNGDTQFACEMYAKMAQTKGNFFISPYSILSALNMLMEGAAGETRKEMRDVLHTTSSSLEASRDLLPSFQKSQDPNQLAIANRIWPSTGIRINPQFSKALKDGYSSTVEPVDFRNKDSRATINDWVEKQTQGKICNLLPKGSVDASTQLVVTNAIYFKGKWDSQFDPKESRDAKFLTSDVDLVPCQMMSQKNRFNYAKVGGIQVVELPYQGRRLALLVLLPSDPSDFARLEKELDAEHLQRWVSALETTQVALSLPRFTQKWQAKLSTPLRALGIRRLFRAGQCDLSSMAAGIKGLFVSEVFHQTFIEMNEVGTETAAATAAVVTRSVPDFAEFTADHTFIYAIRDRQTGQILFLGRLDRP
jgi:serpin B